jgi:hypothetical protein
MDHGCAVTKLSWLKRTATTRFLATATETGDVTIWRLQLQATGFKATIVKQQSFSESISTMHFDVSSETLLATSGCTIRVLSLSELDEGTGYDLKEKTCDSSISGGVLLTSGSYAIVSLRELRTL